VNIPSLFDHLTARVTDAATSHASANDPEAQIRRGSQRDRLLAVYHDYRFSGGLTDEEAGAIINLDQVRATRRCSELRAAGWIEPTGITRTTSNGAAARVCWITPEGLITHRKATR